MEESYIQQIDSLENPNFQEIKRIAKDTCRQTCFGINICKPWKDLGHGVNLLDTHEKCCKYLCAYGNMHEAKIKEAVKHLPIEVLSNSFEIIDWGCGQGLGTICFFDYLKKTGFLKNVKKVILIEPSEKALQRAELHVKSYIKETIPVNVFPEYFENIPGNNIKSKKGLPVIHIFSNILDIKDIDLKNLAKKIDNSSVNDNYIVSVGPINSTNRRIDAFYNYFKSPKLYCNQENSQLYYGDSRSCSYKAKVYKLEYNEQGILIPIEFYPSVQFQSSYQLDCVNDECKKHIDNEELKAIYLTINCFDTSTPFDIGANVYDDIHPILAVLNNIVTRGLPTKTSLYTEYVFKNAFNYTNQFEEHGTLSYPTNKKIDVENILFWYNSVLKGQTKLDYLQTDIEQLQILFSPIAIARVQKTILEALMTEKLDIYSQKWQILVDEKDVPCASIAFNDLKQLFNNLTQLSVDYQNLKFPEIELDIISNDTFSCSKLHLDNANIFSKAQPIHSNKEYDLVIDISMFKTSNINKESFSRFRCKNYCYFNIRSVTEISSERNIYTTDRIVYQDVVNSDGKGNYTEIPETKKLLEYFLQLIFRKESFRPGQLPILNRALQNKSVIGLLPTGGGKSLTYQLAAMLQPGVTLIVDPLRSLILDQYDGLINSGIDSCAYLMKIQKKKKETDLDKENRLKAERFFNESVRKLEQSKLQLIFLSPERLAMYEFREKLKNMHDLNVYFSYGVIDEVHCVSEWGHDFRFSYLHLGRNLYNYVRSKKGRVSLFGLTATASFDVLADVERELSGNGAFPLDSETIVRYENTNRLELQYKIEKVQIDFDNEIKALEKSKFATPGDILQAKARYKFLLDNVLPVPIKLSDEWAFYKGKKAYLKNYISKIPYYIRELQSYDCLQNIKNKFSYRQSNTIGTENDLTVEMPDGFFELNDKYNEAGIIFCPHVSNTDISVKEITESLANQIPNIGSFTGGDEDGDTSMKNLKLFRYNKQPLMVATKAFGMGIDKPNVRFTVNMNYSSSLESFVQEAGRSGRDRKMALAIILLADYKLARINNKYPKPIDPVDKLINKWFKSDDLQQIIRFYKLDIDKQYIDELTPEQDIVRLFCKEGNNPKYFGFNACSDKGCHLYDKCQLRKMPKQAEGWIYAKDLQDIITNNTLDIDSKFIQYQNADYKTVMYFFDNNFKGEYCEKKAMQHILNINNVEIFFGDDAEIKTKIVNGFLTTLLNANEGDEIVSFIKYTTPPKDGGDYEDLAKAIYRMTCIGLIEDFTQDYKNNRFRIVSKRKGKGDYYKAFKEFLERYYSVDRAKEEIKKVCDVQVNANSDLQKEIYQCLNYLTSFVYDKISVKRKRAIDDIRNFCITGIDNTKDWKEINEELKDYIFYYFNSKYSKEGYVADNGEPYCLVIDTNQGRVSSQEILFKYLKVIDENVEQGTPIDNVKHLQGAVRIIRRSITDTNPALDLLNAFCLFYLGTRNNKNLEKELVESYKNGMVEILNRNNDFSYFMTVFNNYNSIIPNIDNKIKELALSEAHNLKFKQITSKYTEQ